MDGELSSFMAEHPYLLPRNLKLTSHLAKQNHYYAFCHSTPILTTIQPAIYIVNKVRRKKRSSTKLFKSLNAHSHQQATYLLQMATGWRRMDGYLLLTLYSSQPLLPPINMQRRRRSISLTAIFRLLLLMGYNKYALPNGWQSCLQLDWRWMDSRGNKEPF
uniref:Uncharacterized protein n=1 Tax=Ditylenchus dipsaci TaxID=166011 RepID=A0A915CQV1_9BILA